MFVQMIQGRTQDAEGLKRQNEAWHQELAPGATGYLGSTAGVAEDGRFVALVRFDSEESARANSDRPEQGAWWAETSKYFDGDPTFLNTTDVDTTLAGGSDDAGFVQIMQGRVSDRARLQELEAEFMPKLAELRPDVIGSIRCWDGDRFSDVIYFTTEAAAREGEAGMESATEEEMSEFTSLVLDLSYIDLKDPWLHSA